MANINVSVTDGNNIVLSLTPPNTQVITIDRGIAGPVGPAGPTTPPGGSNTQVQYNNAGAFAGSANLTFNGTTLTTNTLGAFILGGTVSGGGNQINNVVIGASTPLAGSFTALGASGDVTLSGGTANGVAYLNGSKVLTIGSALTFDGTNLGVGTTSPGYKLDVRGANRILNVAATTGTNGAYQTFSNTAGTFFVGLDSSTASEFGSTAYSANLYHSGNYPMLFWTNGLQRMTLDASGNLGLGITPSAWFSTYKAFQISSNGSLTTNTDFFAVSNNAFTNAAGNDIYLTTGYANRYRTVTSNGQQQWYNAPSGTAGAAITFTQAMTLDASSNLAVAGKVSAVSYTETVFAITGTTPALTPNNGSIQTWTLSGNSTPTAGTWASGQSMTVMIDDGTAFTVTWTSMPITWVGGSAPTLATTGYNIIELWKVNTVIYGAFVGSA